MWNFKYYIIIILVFITTVCLGQNIEEKINTINTDIAVVNTTSRNFKQSLDLVNEDGDAVLNVNYIDKKGKGINNQYQFNFRDLDIEKMVTHMDGEEVGIKLQVIGLNQFVKVSVDNAFLKYDDRIDLKVNDMIKGKSVLAHFISLVDFYQKNEPKNAVPHDFEGIAKWIELNVKGYSVAKGTVEQSAIFDEKYKYIIRFFEKMATSKGQSISEFRWNLVDVDPGNIVTRVKNDLFNIELPIRNNDKFISYKQNGDSRNTVNRVVIVSDNLTLTKQIVIAFTNITKLAPGLFAKNNSAVDQFSSAINFIENELDSKKIDNCIYQINSKGAKGEAIIYEFNFADLDTSSIELVSSGTSFNLQAKVMDKQKFISVTSPSSGRKFDIDFVMNSEELEKLRLLPKVFKVSSTYCKVNNKLEMPTGDNRSKTSWLNQQVSSIPKEKGSYKQSFVLLDNDPCKIVLEVNDEESGKKKSISSDLRLHLFDPELSQIKINSKSATVQLVTKNKEKLIGVSVDEKSKTFINTVDIQTDNIQKSKLVFEIFNQMIKSCTNK
tara:strand:- start:262 stop:1914 length:1653 start_codon:yes stop_codon:yes gene_type:complete